MNSFLFSPKHLQGILGDTEETGHIYITLKLSQGPEKLEQ